MHFQQVVLTVLAFSSSRGGTIESAPAHVHQVSIVPPLGLSRVVVEEDNGVPGLWSVRLHKNGRRTLQSPVYFPPVTTQEALLNALEHAWDMQRRPDPHFPFLTRFLEPPRTPPRSASPPHRQRGVSPQTPPHHE
jgi:hypothetical protein